MISGITKKLKKLSAAKVGNRQVGRWVPALVNHLYKVISESDPKSMLRTEWWRSGINHICNIHIHDSEIFPKCLHEDLIEEREGEDGKLYVRDWIDPGNLLLYCTGAF